MSLKLASAVQAGCPSNDEYLPMMHQYVGDMLLASQLRLHGGAIWVVTKKYF
jgi:hypothetical protein